MQRFLDISCGPEISAGTQLASYAQIVQNKVVLRKRAVPRRWHRAQPTCLSQAITRSSQSIRPTPHTQKEINWPNYKPQASFTLPKTGQCADTNTHVESDCTELPTLTYGHGLNWFGSGSGRGRLPVATPPRRFVHHDHCTKRAGGRFVETRPSIEVGAPTFVKVLSSFPAQFIHRFFHFGPLQHQSPPVQVGAVTQRVEGSLQHEQRLSCLILHVKIIQFRGAAFVHDRTAKVCGSKDHQSFLTPYGTTGEWRVHRQLSALLCCKQQRADPFPRTLASCFVRKSTNPNPRCEPVPLSFLGSRTVLSSPNTLQTTQPTIARNTSWDV